MGCIDTSALYSANQTKSDISNFKWYKTQYLKLFDEKKEAFKSYKERLYNFFLIFTEGNELKAQILIRF